MTSSLPTDPRERAGQSVSQSLPTSFARFAETAEEVGATAKRLEKASILKRYFETLLDQDLRLAARYLAGFAFPLHDQRTIQVGGSALLAALRAASGAEEESLLSRW